MDRQKMVMENFSGSECTGKSHVFNLIYKDVIYFSIK